MPTTVFNDDGGTSCTPHCDFLFARYTGSTNTEHALLGAAPSSLSSFRPWLLSHRGPLHVDGSPATRANASFAEGGAVYAAMVASGDFCASSARQYAQLFLMSGLDVVIYAGNLDPLLGAPIAEAGVRVVRRQWREPCASSLIP